jgi:L-rhamnonate dehydratase
MALEYLNDLMWRSTQRFGAGGLASVAQSGIDLALWDLKGKLLDQPVYRLLGGPSRDRILCYATSDDLDWSKELGFKHFNVSNPAHYDSGIDGLNMVEEKIASARETVGPGAELMYNPVMSFNVEFAVRMAERLRPYGLRWLEEPLVPGDLEGHVELRKRVGWMPIATGEDHHGRWTFRQLIEHRAVDVLQPDIKWCGGLSEAIKIYTLGEAAGLITVPHTGAGTPWGQHFSMAMPESPMAEFVTPSDAPGFGMEIAEEWITPWVH